MTDAIEAPKKTLGTFKKHLEGMGWSPVGAGDYHVVESHAVEYFGHKLTNPQTWRVINSFGKPKAVEVEDDL